MQEPDSFSQRLVRGLQLPHPRAKAILLDILLSRTRHDLAALSSCRHLTTLARNEAPVEISIEHRSAPSAHHRRRDTSVHQPRTFRSIRATLVREHQITHFFVTEPHSDRHHDLLQITSQTTHNQPDKEGNDAGRAFIALKLDRRSSTERGCARGSSRRVPSHAELVLAFGERDGFLPITGRRNPARASVKPISVAETHQRRENLQRLERLASVVDVADGCAG